ncbi:hypothetical protein [Lutibacter oricola]|nr:hypothetical protein [Lutibacter oricola]
MLFFIIVFTFFIFTIVLNNFVDGNTLIVDRWSAIDVSVHAVLNGEYPYSIPNHLGQYSSNLPSLVIIGLPFYLFGDVGFLQSFTFLFFAYILHKSFTNYKVKLLGILLLISSIFYLWEVYTKSELMSNFIFVLGFIVLWSKKYSKSLFKKSFLLGVITSFIALTRIPVLIPLVIFLFKDFLNTSIKKKIYFIISSMVVTLFLGFVVLKDCPNIEVLKNYNPLTLQGNKTPLLISLISLLLPFFISFKVKNEAINTVLYSIPIILIPILGHFLSSWFNYGFEKTIFNSFADISYFNMVSPLLIYYIIYSFNKEVFKPIEEKGTE